MGVHPDHVGELNEETFGELDRMCSHGKVRAVGEIGQDYLDLREREALWGSSAVDNQAKISQAVSETKGMYLTWEGKLIEPAYFWLSAGKTRTGREVLGEG